MTKYWFFQLEFSVCDWLWQPWQKYSRILWGGFSWNHFKKSFVVTLVGTILRYHLWWLDCHLKKRLFDVTNLPLNSNMYAFFNNQRNVWNLWKVNVLYLFIQISNRGKIFYLFVRISNKRKHMVFICFNFMIMKDKIWSAWFPNVTHITLFSGRFETFKCWAGQPSKHRHSIQIQIIVRQASLFVKNDL